MKELYASCSKSYYIRVIALNRKPGSPQYLPDYMAESVSDIDFNKLKKSGIKYIAFDADSTLVHLHGTVTDPDTLDKLKTNRKKFKDWCVASNRIKDNLRPLARTLEAEVIRAGIYSRKPRKHYFRRVIKYFENNDPSEIAMVGDKLIADMWGAKRMGITTVWVENMGPDSILDKLVKSRHLEAWLMKKYSERHKSI